MSDSPLDYANPFELPPPGTGVTIEIVGDDTVIVIPRAPAAPELIATCFKLIVSGLLVALLIAIGMHAKDGWKWVTPAFGIVAIPLVFGVGAARGWRKVRLPVVIRANRRELLVVNSALYPGEHVWKVCDIGSMNVSIGLPTLTARTRANLYIGSWTGWIVILLGRDKRELEWISRAANRAMGKE